jgi:hypothetical protein
MVVFEFGPLCPKRKGPRQPLDRRLGRPHSWSGRYGEEKYTYLLALSESPAACTHWSIVANVTVWSRVLLERPAVVRPLDSFPAFYGTRRFIAAFTRALHLCLS